MSPNGSVPFRIAYHMQWKTLVKRDHHEVYIEKILLPYMSVTREMSWSLPLITQHWLYLTSSQAKGQRQSQPGIVGGAVLERPSVKIEPLENFTLYGIKHSRIRPLDY